MESKHQSEGQVFPDKQLCTCMYKYGHCFAIGVLFAAATRAGITDTSQHVAVGCWSVAAGRNISAGIQ
jgi:hypothetical protein